MYKLVDLLKKRKTDQSVKHSNKFFHVVICGRTGSGKTRLLIELLKNEFFDEFNAIFLICPTFEKNNSYNEDILFKDDKFYILPRSVEHLDESIDQARHEARKYHRSLIIFDDVIGNTMMTSRVGKYVNLLIGARHDGCSTITLQQLNSISKPARDQMTRVISFYTLDAIDRKILFDKYLVDVEKEERSDIFAYLHEKDFRYIDIDILHGRYRLG